MAIQTVAILSPGDMGHAVGRALREHGIDVITSLDGRSARTRALADSAGICDAGSIEAVAASADLVLSILVPSEAVEAAGLFAGAMRADGRAPAFADCNAISPASARRAAQAIHATGGSFIDAGIIGGPPGEGSVPRFYAAGPDVSPLTALHGMGIEVRAIGEEIGRASGIKMCYAALTKGTSALQAALLTAAEVMGLSAELTAELRTSQAAAYQAMERGVPGLGSRAYRWIGEMEEIAATFEGAGVTGKLHQGAAELFRMIAATVAGADRLQGAHAARGLDETVRIFADAARGASAPRP